MSDRIQILVVEDCLSDAELLIDGLRREGFEPVWRRVQTEAAFLELLRPDLDLILCDYQMPSFSAPRALELLKQQACDVPLIVISGVLGDEAAVEMLRLGAVDYLLKDRMSRVGLAVRHAIEQSRLRRDHQHAEQAVHEGEYKFRTLFDAALEPIYMLENGVFVDCNTRGQFMYGRTREEIIGHSPDEFCPTEQPDGRNSREKAFAIVQKCMAGEPQFFEWVSLHANGTPVFSDVSLNRLKLGEKIYLLAIARDVTERKRTEKTIEEQAALLDEARDAIVLRDLDGKIIFWNKGAERVYGWSSQDVVGLNVLEILRTNPKRFAEINEATITRGEWMGEIQHLGKDGREIIVSIRCSLIRDDAGKPKSILSISTDITEKKKIESQFLRAQRMESIGALAGGVAHDLNNILAPIMMSIVILKAITDNQQANEILDSIKHSAKRGADIVKQLLSFARGLEGHRIEVQLKHLLKELECILKDTFPKDIRLRFAASDDLWTVNGDPTQIHQILLNLCVNSRDAMPDGGDLIVTLENSLLDDDYVATHVEAKAGRYVKLVVADTGAGISQAIIDRIFEPFFTTKDMDKGTGLGLSTVMAIVKSHDGIINVSSTSGQGTIFTIWLPAIGVTSEPIEEHAESDPLPRGAGETILIVDDEASILAVTSHTLEAFGYRVLTATDGTEAVAIYEQKGNEISLVLTDMAMPVMDGRATINALMKLNPEVKIVASSGLASDGSVSRALDAGTKHFLAKPYTTETLLRTLRMTLEEAPRLEPSARR